MNSNTQEVRRTARSSLKGNWAQAIAAYIIAALTGVFGSSVLSFLVRNRDRIPYEKLGLYNLNQSLPENAWFAIALVGIALFFIGFALRLGYFKFNLGLIRTKQAQIPTLFSMTKYMGRAITLYAFRSSFVALWSLLLIVPGIIAELKYAMAEYIMADDPEVSPFEAISMSKEMMDGHKWRLFCLQLRFMLWDLLSLLTLGIATIWVNPYREASYAAFYEEISK